MFIVAQVTTLLLNGCLMLNLLSISVSSGKCSDILQVPNMGLAIIFTDVVTDSTNLGRRWSQVFTLKFDNILVTVLRLGTFFLIFKIG